MGWTTLPYCDLGDVHAALGFASTDTQDDTWLSALIPIAQQLIDEELGYTFQQNVGGTNTYDGPADEQTQLLIDDCVSISRVLETTYNVWLGSGGVYQSGTVQTTDITADCILVPVSNTAGYGILLKRKTGLPFLEGIQNYAVTGTWGRPGIPADITYACTRLVVHMYKMRSQDYGATPADAEFGAIKYSSSWPADVRKILCDRKLRGFWGR